MTDVPALPDGRSGPTGSGHQREDLADRLTDASNESRGALAKLTHDQMALLEAWLDGFESRAAVLRWMQEAAIQSLGQLGDDWFKRQVCDPNTVSALLGRPWGPVEAGDLSREWMAQHRRDVAAKDLLGVFHDASRTFRWSAGDYYGESDDQREMLENADLDEQHPALRPELDDVSSQQRRALQYLLDGFADADAFLVWGQYVVKATYAEIDRETIKDAYFDLVVRDWMTSPEDPTTRFWRETWAAKFYLPGCNRTAAQLASRTTESIERTKSETHAPPG